MKSFKILWFNWRCIKHPLAGGAEVYTHEIAKRLVKRGYEVILVTSKPDNLAKQEIIDGYKVIRAGNKYTVYLCARQIYRRLKKNGWKPDIIIDEVNTIPFLTPKYVAEPIVMLIHQLCKECWSYAIHPLAQPIGWWLERSLHRTYIKSIKNGKVGSVITVSDSTKQDLVNLGYPADVVHIVYNGLDWELYRSLDASSRENDEKENLCVYIGRITPYKNLEDLLEAWKIIEQEEDEPKLIIAGRAERKYLEKLRRIARELGLERIRFMINISQQEKLHLLRKAKALVYTSVREGWGQTVLEAAACKTPTIAYNVPGLRDSVKHMETGLLVELGNIQELAESMELLLKDDELREELSKNAAKWAEQFSWDKTAKEFEKSLDVILTEEENC